MSVEADSPIDDSPAPERGPIGSLFKSLSNLLATFIAIAHTRLELLTTELQEEMHRIAEVLMWSLVALLSAGIGLFLAALVVIFLFWDTHRLFASIAVTAFFFLLALTAALILRSKVRNRPKLLENTLAELAKDRKQLERRL
ncbi:MAG TPA: phage holin family protein [Gemmatimonadaceae bacterium]|nr:phage holin family protein [Gemmatimonadaceae bacterium]